MQATYLDVNNKYVIPALTKDSGSRGGELGENKSAMENENTPSNTHRSSNMHGKTLVNDLKVPTSSNSASDAYTARDLESSKTRQVATSANEAPISRSGRKEEDSNRKKSNVSKRKHSPGRSGKHEKDSIKNRLSSGIEYLRTRQHQSSKKHATDGNIQANHDRSDQLKVDTAAERRVSKLKTGRARKTKGEQLRLMDGADDTRDAGDQQQRPDSHLMTSISEQERSVDRLLNEVPDWNVHRRPDDRRSDDKLGAFGPEANEQSAMRDGITRDSATMDYQNRRHSSSQVRGHTNLASRRQASSEAHPYTTDLDDNRPEVESGRRIDRKRRLSRNKRHYLNLRRRRETTTNQQLYQPEVTPETPSINNMTSSTSDSTVEESATTEASATPSLAVAESGTFTGRLGDVLPVGSNHPLRESTLPLPEESNPPALPSTRVTDELPPEQSRDHLPAFIQSAARKIRTEMDQADPNVDVNSDFALKPNPIDDLLGSRDKGGQYVGGNLNQSKAEAYPHLFPPNNYNYDYRNGGFDTYDSNAPGGGMPNYDYGPPIDYGDYLDPIDSVLRSKSRDENNNPGGHGDYGDYIGGHDPHGNPDPYGYHGNDTGSIPFHEDWMSNNPPNLTNTTTHLHDLLCKDIECGSAGCDIINGSAVCWCTNSNGPPDEYNMCPHNPVNPINEYRNLSKIDKDTGFPVGITPRPRNDSLAKDYRIAGHDAASNVHLSILKFGVPVLGFLILILIIIIIVLKRKKTDHRRQPKPESPITWLHRQDSIMLLENLTVLSKNPNYYTPEFEASSLSNLKTRVIPREGIRLLQEVGEGAFGKVYKGEIRVDAETLEHVAVKVLKDGVSRETREDFKREVEIMSSFDHENILKLIGVVALEEESPFMVFEYMEHGDLADLLRRNDPCMGNREKRPELKQADLVDIATQISHGMVYLTSQHFIHRDLATRNCLVGSELVVKISDFGMSRDIYTCDYYRIGGSRMLPVRWMSPESVKYGRFTSESDVWSYGVILWEIFSFGKQPYYGHSNEEVIRFIEDGILLQRPDDCPSTVYHVMLGCWRSEPRDRFNFERIHRHLVEYSQKMVKCYHQMGQDLVAMYEEV